MGTFNDDTKEIKKSRLEINIKLLLKKCEEMAKKDDIDDNWRLKKYVECLTQMLSELKADTEKPPKEVLSEYSKRIEFLKGVINITTLSSPIEKVGAVQLLSHGSAISNDTPVQEIRQKTAAKYGTELRSDLFGFDNDDTLRQRNIIKTPNFTSNTGGQEDMDTLLKYHQNMQEKVAENMVLLTKSLKEQSQIASTIIKRDTEALQQSSTLTDRNLQSLQVESTRLQEHSRRAWKCWLWIMLAAVLFIFLNMVLFMRVTKKSQQEPNIIMAA